MDMHFEMRRGYLYVQITGTFDLDEVMLLYFEALEEADRQAATKVLIDCLELKGLPTVADRYRFGVFAAEQLRDSVSRSAYSAE